MLNWRSHVWVFHSDLASGFEGYHSGLWLIMIPQLPRPEWSSELSIPSEIFTFRTLGNGTLKYGPMGYWFQNSKICGSESVESIFQYIHGRDNLLVLQRERKGRDCGSQEGQRGSLLIFKVQYCYKPGSWPSLVNRNWWEARQEIQARLYWGSYCTRREKTSNIPLLVPL